MDRGAPRRDALGFAKEVAKILLPHLPLDEAASVIVAILKKGVEVRDLSDEELDAYQLAQLQLPEGM